MNGEAIKAHLPHRYPFLLVDRVLVREPGVRVVAEKLLTINEPYFQGHFAERPLLPGVLMLEMLAQAGGFLEPGPLAGKAIFLAQVLDARFKGAAFPGDKLRLEVLPDASFGGLMRIKGTVSCEGHILCTAKLMLKNSIGPEGAA
jgi:3-hydroxyacyl-[acyl-carrier-protein] dehydratase